MKLIKTLMALLFVLPLICNATHISVSGVVSGNWSADTVFVEDNIEILNLQTLHISPGVEVIFLGHYVFVISGCLKAQGTPNHKISFTVSDTTGFYSLNQPDGGWNGLWFDHLGPANDSSVFEYCSFRYGKATGADSTYWYGGAACIRDYSRVRFSHCEFEHNRAYKNGGAIYARQSNLKIENCVFIGNDCGLTDLYGYGGGLCLEYADATVNRNYFTLNSSTGVGGGLSFEFADPLIANNHFYNNYSAIGGGFVCLRSAGANTIANNLVEGNEALFFGGGIAVLETSALFANNTIVNNITGGGGGLYFNANAFSVFKNCIVWGNTGNAGGSQVYIWDTFSAPEFYYCDIEGGLDGFGGTGGAGGGFIGVYENNLQLNPDFAGQGAHPFLPGPTSPCINSGTPDTTGLHLPAFDLAFQPRLSNGCIDMGAYESGQTTPVDFNVDNGRRLLVCPNPFQTQGRLWVDVTTATLVRVTIVDLHGSVKKVIYSGMLGEGNHEFIIGDLKAGFYIAQLKTPSGMSQTKFIVR